MTTGEDVGDVSSFPLRFREIGFWCGVDLFSAEDMWLDAGPGQQALGAAWSDFNGLTNPPPYGPRPFSDLKDSSLSSSLLLL